MNKIIYTVITILLIGFFAYQIKSTVKSGQTSGLPNVIINNRIFKVEIADTLTKQIKGLSGKKNICSSCGMLFIFPDSQVRKFWMKDMNFPLDIIWINNGKIVNISKNLLPEGENPSKTYSSVAQANYVLEINAGQSDKLNINIGDKITYNFVNK
jgi:uncharacterized membrane protein (UPF0127 family)